ncbi:hypothetical protein RZS28_04055 [Methylocapsa polymorpha]|uniref:Uncharacterized protein n=1 Tax=Methylocapsa polymorpha TaxID=3080828 RepID=A0ABZ0HTE1_9HYPH|nr:hypothetical protein RZS28_04055 [Methylocapsa sp. RX1]
MAEIARHGHRMQRHGVDRLRHVRKLCIEPFLFAFKVQEAVPNRAYFDAALRERVDQARQRSPNLVPPSFHLGAHGDRFPSQLDSLGMVGFSKFRNHSRVTQFGAEAIHCDALDFLEIIDASM